MDRELKDLFFTCIFEESDEAVIGLDASHVVQTLSRGACELLTLPREVAVGRDFAECFPDPTDCERLLEAASGVPIFKNFETRLRRGDGSIEKVFLTVHVLGDPVSAYLILITPSVIDFDTAPEHRAIQQSLVRMERFSAVGRMATAFAHEMRTPLHVISSTAEFSLEFLSPDEKMRENLGMILRNARYAALSIRALLDFAKVGKAEMREGSLNEVIRTVLRLVEKTCHRRRIDLDSDLAGIPSLLLDEQQIRAVVHNIVVNAIEAMPEGGRLRVATAAGEDGGVTLTVEDTGVGMSAEVCGRVDTAFFTTKEDGTGLGLYLAKRVLAEHGASIAFDSAPDCGTTVSVRFAPEPSKP